MMNINYVKNIVAYIAYNAPSIPILFQMCRIVKIANTIKYGRLDISIMPGFHLIF